MVRSNNEGISSPTKSLGPRTPDVCLCRSGTVTSVSQNKTVLSRNDILSLTCMLLYLAPAARRSHIQGHTCLTLFQSSYASISLQHMYRQCYDACYRQSTATDTRSTASLQHVQYSQRASSIPRTYIIKRHHPVQSQHVTKKNSELINVF